MGDALISKGSREYEMVLTNPPFEKKSKVTVIGEDGEEQREALTIAREDFWATTSNKQLNFLQHVRSILKIDGQAAIVAPDNVLFFDRKIASEKPWTKRYGSTISARMSTPVSTSGRNRQLVGIFVRLLPV